MKKRLFFYLLFLLPAFAFARPDDHIAPTTSDDPRCAAPPPGWLIVTQATPTSISLMWEQSQLNMLFKVEGYNITGGFALPTHYTHLNTITYDSLTPGNYYRFDVSATYCPETPIFGEKASCFKWTPRIIIDYVVETQENCSPGNGSQTYSGQVVDICVKQSNEPEEPYNNTFIGRIKDNDDNIIEFVVAYNETEAVVGGLSHNSAVSYVYTPNQQYMSVDCYLSTPLLSHKVFTINNMLAVSPGEASLKLIFHGTYFFEYCTFCGESRQRTSDYNTGGRSWEESTEQQNNKVLTQVNPNPFTTSTTFRYTLPEPGPVEISLYDAMGRRVKVVEKTALQAAGDYEVTVDGADLPDGVYFLHTLTGQSRKVSGLVKRG